MTYNVNESLFVRKEKKDEENIYFVYVGDSDEMYELNEASFDCFSMLEDKLSYEEICDALSKKYCKTSRDLIEKNVQQSIDQFIAAGIIKQEE